MTERFITGPQQKALEELVDACGLDLVLGALANICAEKADHVLTNWQDRALADAWTKAMTKLDLVSVHATIRRVS